MPVSPHALTSTLKAHMLCSSSRSLNFESLCLSTFLCTETTEKTSAWRINFEKFDGDGSNTVGREEFKSTMGATLFLHIAFSVSPPRSLCFSLLEENHAGLIKMTWPHVSFLIINLANLYVIFLIINLFLIN